MYDCMLFAFNIVNYDSSYSFMKNLLLRFLYEVQQYGA